MTGKPSWQSTLIGLAFIALVGGIFLAVYERSGIDAAIKAWGAIGTIVGVVVGVIPGYFFGRGNTETLRQQTEATNQQLQDEQNLREAADARSRLVLGLSNPAVIEQARAARPDLF